MSAFDIVILGLQATGIAGIFLVLATLIGRLSGFNDLGDE